MKRLQLVGLIAVALCAASAAHAEGDKSRGRELVYTCNGCHGVPGYSNVYPDYHVPHIAGQNELYIVNALKSYKSGERKHPTMTAQAESLSDKDISDIAAYLSSIAK
ncbi:c-type cytochrome [Luteibacter sp. NPDC031894]|jgi:cytochrome c553|uniref:c-type cytochrome n=1 Tax=Luteibacter sp. NPDC031894 TaxID=3390572 RepID=UPI003D08835D